MKRFLILTLAWCAWGIPSAVLARDVAQDPAQYDRLQQKRIAALKQDVAAALKARNAGSERASLLCSQAYTTWNSILFDRRKAIEADSPGFTEAIAAFKGGSNVVLTADQLAVLVKFSGAKVGANAAQSVARPTSTVTIHETRTRSPDSVVRDVATSQNSIPVSTVHEVTVKEGNTTLRDTLATSPKATVTSHEEWVKSGSAVTHTGVTTGSNGRVSTIAETTTRDGGTTVNQGTRTNNGKATTWTDTTVRSSDSITNDKLATGPSGTTVSKDAWIKSDNTVTREGQTVKNGLQTNQRSETFTREGDTVHHVAAFTSKNGTTSRDDTLTREGNKVTETGKIVRADGTVLTGNTVTVRDGSTTTRDTTISGPNGTFTFHDVWTKIGNVLRHVGSTLAPTGEQATRESTVVKNGNVTQGHSEKSFPNGATVTRDSLTVKSGNTTVRDTTIRGNLQAADQWQAAARQGYSFFSASWSNALNLLGWNAKPAPVPAK